MIEARPTARRIILGLALAAALATSACAAGQIAETAKEKATLDGTNVDVGKMALRGLAVQTPDAVNYPVGSDLRMSVSFINNSANDDKLVSISSRAATSWGAYASSADLSTPSSATGSASASSVPTNDASAGAVLPSAGSTAPTGAQAEITLPAGVSTAFGVPVADNRVLALTGTKRVLYPGNEISITFTFANAGSKTFDVPIQISSSGTGTYQPKSEYLPTDGASEGTG